MPQIGMPRTNLELTVDRHSEQSLEIRVPSAPEQVVTVVAGQAVLRNPEWELPLPERTYKPLWMGGSASFALGPTLRMALRKRTYVDSIATVSPAQWHFPVTVGQVTTEELDETTDVAVGNTSIPGEGWEVWGTTRFDPEQARVVLTVSVTVQGAAELTQINYHVIILSTIEELQQRFSVSGAISRLFGR